MMKIIEICFSPINIKIRAELLENLNPVLCKILWDSLPYRSIQCHALVAGEQLYHYTPIIEAIPYKAQTKEDKTEQLIGRINMSSLQLMSIKYGLITEYLESVPVAQVVEEDLNKLKKVGEIAWESVYKTKELIVVTVKKSDQEVAKEFTGVRRPKFQSTNRALIRFVNQVYDEIEKIWLKPPTELVAIHEGKIKSGAGSYSQYFSTLVFVNGEIRHLGYNALGGLLKVCVNPKVSLPVLKELISPFTRTCAGFLGYCGLESLDKFIEQGIELGQTVKTKTEFMYLIGALTLYTNRLHGWSLHLFPWKHGDKHKIKKDESGIKNW